MQDVIGRRADVSREGHGPRPVPGDSPGACERHLPEHRHRAARSAGSPEETALGPPDRSPSVGERPARPGRGLSRAAPVGPVRWSRRRSPLRTVPVPCVTRASTSSPAASEASGSSSPGTSPSDTGRGSCSPVARRCRPPRRVGLLARGHGRDATASASGRSGTSRRRGQKSLYWPPTWPCATTWRESSWQARAPLRADPRASIHSAGVAGGGIIQLKEREAAAHGSWPPRSREPSSWRQVLKDEPLDFLAALLVGGGRRRRLRTGRLLRRQRLPRRLRAPRSAGDRDPPTLSRELGRVEGSRAWR